MKIGLDRASDGDRMNGLCETTQATPNPPLMGGFHSIKGINKINTRLDLLHQLVHLAYRYHPIYKPSQ